MVEGNRALLRPGLVSVTFRQFTPPEIVALASEAGLHGIEWGGDVHVPPGDTARAREVGTLTRDTGIAVVAYGSYYRVGPPSEQADFEQVLECAAALGAPTIRVWAGSRPSPEADAAHRESVAADSRRICDLAAAAGITIAYEFHGGTLTDTVASTLALLDAVGRPGLRTLWQPLGEGSPASRQAELDALLPRLGHLHVYQWRGSERLALSQGEAEWAAVLSTLAAAQRPTDLLLEFVRDASPAHFREDAATLCHWCGELGRGPRKDDDAEYDA